MPTHYLVQVPLPGNPTPLDLCRCLSPESAGAIVSALLLAGRVEPIFVQPVEDYAVPAALLGQVVVGVDDLRQVLALLLAPDPTAAPSDDATRAAIVRLREAVPPF